jgi:hypothetical protein
LQFIQSFNKKEILLEMTNFFLKGEDNMAANMEQLQAWKETVYPALLSKAEEFHLLGYERVTPNEVWNCIMAKLGRKNEEYMLHQFINVILRMSVNEYMNWLTIQAYQAPGLFIGDQPS